jgi:hypothetical protein
LETGENSFQFGKGLFKMKNGGSRILLVNGNFYSFLFIVAASVIITTGFFHTTQAAMPGIFFHKSGIGKPPHAIMHMKRSAGGGNHVNESKYGYENLFHIYPEIQRYKNSSVKRNLLIYGIPPMGQIQLLYHRYYFTF